MTCERSSLSDVTDTAALQKVDHLLSSAITRIGQGPLLLQRQHCSRDRYQQEGCEDDDARDLKAADAAANM